MSGALVVPFCNRGTLKREYRNTNIAYDKKTFSGLSWKSGIQGQTIGKVEKTGYVPVSLLPIALQRAATTLFSFQISADGSVYMTTNSTYDESNATETVGVLWIKA